MKRQYVATVLACLTMMQTTAHADILDLPNPNEPEAEVVVRPPAPPPIPNPSRGQVTNSDRPSNQGQRITQDSTRINGVSRKSGGETYSVDLSTTTPLSRLEMSLLSSRVKISSVTVITDSSRRYQIRDLSGETLQSGKITISANLNISEKVSSLEIQAESFGSEGDIRITAISSSSENFNLVVRRSSDLSGGSRCNENINDDNKVKARLDQAQVWILRMDQSPSGSSQQQFAHSQAQQIVNQAIEVLKSNDVKISELYAKNLAAFYDGKYRNAASGSYPEGLYLILARAFRDTQVKAVERKMDCYVNSITGSSVKLIQLAEEHYRNYLNAPRNSLEESSSLKMFNAIKEKIMPTFANELRQINSFEKLEADLFDFDAKYQRASSGYFEALYRQMAQLSREKAISVFELNVRNMSAEDKYSLVVKYDAIYRAATSGSTKEAFARDLVNILMRR